jgi:starch synthase
MKSGILYSDFVTTVSATYAKEIQTSEYGCGLEGVLRKRSECIFGIINGIDYKIWDPLTDKLIHKKYNNFADKQKNKEHLTNNCNISSNQPLLGMVSRIADQKGFDIIIRSFDEIMDMNFNFILLGLGDERYHKKLKKLEDIYPCRTSINIKFDEKLAHRIYAGSDFFLMPSRYEPCGLGQMISLKYGVVPIVRKIGGLADTIKEFSPSSITGSGFLFKSYECHALLNALSKAYKVYSDRNLFERLSEMCMKFNFSWTESAKRYKALYKLLLSS